MTEPRDGPCAACAARGLCRVFRGGWVHRDGPVRRRQTGVCQTNLGGRLKGRRCPRATPSAGKLRRTSGSRRSRRVNLNAQMPSTHRVRWRAMRPVLGSVRHPDGYADAGTRSSSRAPEPRAQDWPAAAPVCARPQARWAERRPARARHNPASPSAVTRASTWWPVYPLIPKHRHHRSSQDAQTRHADPSPIPPAEALQRSSITILDVSGM